MSAVWVFGYGSLIWRPDFGYIDRQPAAIKGWTRRFWQGSHDHRGVPDSPGRVVTLIQQADAVCHGMAYLIDADVVTQTFEHLDHREKNGYERFEVDLTFGRGSSNGLVYIAPQDNFAFLGEAPLAEMAAQIATSHGPSGSNAEYLFELAEALRTMGVEDGHVFALERTVKIIIAVATDDA